MWAPSTYLLVAGDPLANALQLGVTDVMELVVGHGDNGTAHGHEPPTVLHEEAVVRGKGLKDLQGEGEQPLSMCTMATESAYLWGAFLYQDTLRDWGCDTPILEKGKERLKEQ